MSLLVDVFSPFFIHFGGWREGFDEAFDEFPLVAEFGACVDGLADFDDDFLILKVTVVVGMDEKEYVVNIDFHLLDKFHLKYDVIVDVFFFNFVCTAILLVQVYIDTLIVLEINRCKDLFVLELVKSSKDIAKTEDGTVEADEVFFACPSKETTSEASSSCHEKPAGVETTCIHED